MNLIWANKKIYLLNLINRTTNILGTKKNENNKKATNYNLGGFLNHYN